MSPAAGEEPGTLPPAAEAAMAAQEDNQEEDESQPELPELHPS